MLMYVSFIYIFKFLMILIYVLALSIFNSLSGVCVCVFLFLICPSSTIHEVASPQLLLAHFLRSFSFYFVINNNEEAT